MSRRTFAVRADGPFAAPPSAAAASQASAPWRTRRAIVAGAQSPSPAARLCTASMSISSSGTRRNSGLAFDPGYRAADRDVHRRVAAASHSRARLFADRPVSRRDGPATYQASYAGPIVDTGRRLPGPGSTCTEPLPPPLGTGPPGWSAASATPGSRTSSGAWSARGASRRGCATCTWS